MRLTLVGGGGFRVPLIYQALLGEDAPRVSEVVLYDIDRSRMQAISHVLAQMAAGHASPPSVRSTTDLDESLHGADFVFSAIRVGGLEGRTRDEHIPLAANVLGQETVGAGGVLYGLRTIPVAMDIARRVAGLAPEAWLINFTNPAGMVTEALSTVLGDRVIGICDSPAGLCQRAARALGTDPDRGWFDYVGLNHLGWLRGLCVDGRDRLPDLLADQAALASFEEGELFGPEWLRALGAIPNEYLHYYYFPREAVRAIQRKPATRGDYLLAQQAQFYSAATADPGTALDKWHETRRSREATYMAENREVADAGPREPAQGHGYESVALAVMRAIADNRQARLILNVRNRSAIPGLPADAVVEVPCLVAANGAHPFAAGAVDQDKLALMTAVKSAERDTVEAALTGSRQAALRALANHPLVDSVAVAREILEEYLKHAPQQFLGEYPPAKHNSDQ